MRHFEIHGTFACGADAVGRRGFSQGNPVLTECLDCKATEAWMDALAEHVGAEVAEEALRTFVAGLEITQVQALPNDTKGKYPNGIVRTLHGMCIDDMADEEMGSIPAYGKYHWKIKLDSLWWIITEDDQGFVSAHGTDKQEHSDRQWHNWAERIIYS